MTNRGRFCGWPCRWTTWTLPSPPCAGEYWWASIYAALAALIFAYFFSRSFSRRIARLRAFAEGLVGAHFSQAPLPVADDELGALGRSLGTTAAQLRDLVDRLSVESAQREAILASMVEGVLAVDSKLRITFANQSFARAVGAPYPDSPQSAAGGTGTRSGIA